ncbi:urea ABC transporter permease subunit UrtB [Uliginosibacterium sp. H1]|uniref:urea ABC transporter permease subunit UrtB n=1 Tax=Uliginosibacterium sp. H1 TaxID=3114757 RepID=UPI002E17877A|nr:urea ABC transporter permease subunit UrtB [Uliginosibacterium sp. H1]
MAMTHAARPLPALFADVLMCLALCLGMLGTAHAAIPKELILQLATGDSDEKIAAMGQIAATADPAALPLLQAMDDGRLQVLEEKQQVLLYNEAGEVTDAVTGAKLDPVPEGAEDITVNNRLRSALEGAMAALQLTAADTAVRLDAARKIKSSATPEMLPLIERAMKAEKDPQVGALLRTTQASLQLASDNVSTRIAAVKSLASSGDSEIKQLLLGLLEKNGETFKEPEAAVRIEAQKAISDIDGRLKMGEYAGMAFTGISLGSILLLAALGLAITYGLMGVINMAHGELIMIGAYATYLTQNLVRAWAPGLFELYPLLAVPVSFTAAALVGVAMERIVIRHLYGRPLETLLATWGISLMLIQLVRSLFGAQNVPLENPQWLSGGFQVMSNLILPYNRIAIIVFAGLVVAGMALILTKTRLGLFVRAVTQNRNMASCVGVATPRVDTVAFGLGSGIAGLAGCALSQVGNVGPDLGQSYIIDSFMVVVLGGVGQLAGTVYAALGLGVINKLFEAQAGAVLAKIAVLVIIIVFIQKRPQGLFAVRGRFVEQ